MRRVSIGTLAAVWIVTSELWAQAPADAPPAEASSPPAAAGAGAPPDAAPAPAAAGPGTPPPGGAAAPAGYPPPQQYPPPYYPYPYPYPPSPRYLPPGYPAPPSSKPARAAIPPVHPQALVRSSPFINVLAGGMVFNQRFETIFAPGMEFGLFIADRVRLGLRAQVPLEEPRDSHDYAAFGGGFESMASEPISAVFAGSLGIAAVAAGGFALSPGVVALRTDVADYGTMVGIALPFEWITRRGLRIGFDFALVRGFGGEVRARCNDFGGTATSCDSGEVRLFDREAGNGFYSNFFLGWAFSRPDEPSE